MRPPMLNNSNPGQEIYEPFPRCGTTPIAAQPRARVCLAVEIDPLFVDLAIRRWQAFAGAKAIREIDGVHFAALDLASQPTSSAS
jgi:DNA modification methylase